jgi:hypothetical protein
MTTYSHAGVSTLNGVTKVRFANDALRVKVLAKNGHKDIDIVELKNPMSKEDAVAFLFSIDFATQNGKTNALVQAALEDAVEKRAPKVAKVKVAKVAKVVKPKAAAKPTMDAIKAKVAAAKKVVPATVAKPKSTVTKAQIEAQLADKTLDDAPF